MTKFQKKKCLEAAEQKTSKLLVVVCCCKTVGEYENIEKDGFSIDRGEYVYNWDDSEYRREEEEERRQQDDEDDW